MGVGRLPLGTFAVASLAGNAMRSKMVTRLETKFRVSLGSLTFRQEKYVSFVRSTLVTCVPQKEHHLISPTDPASVYLVYFLELRK